MCYTYYEMFLKASSSNKSLHEFFERYLVDSVINGNSIISEKHISLIFSKIKLESELLKLSKTGVIEVVEWEDYSKIVDNQWMINSNVFKKYPIVLLFISSFAKSTQIYRDNNNNEWYNWFTLSFVNDYKVNGLLNKQSSKKSKYLTYLMLDSNTNLTKIGKSKNPEIREKTLQSEKPTIGLFAICDLDFENELHEKFKNLRIRGEWFDLSDSDIKFTMKEYGFVDKKI